MIKLKKWLSTMTFIFFLLFGYPLIRLFSKIDVFEKSAYKIIGILCIVVYIWYLISSIYRMKHGEAVTLLLQAFVVQVPILLVQALLLVLITVVGLINIFALPIAYFFILCFNCVIGFARTLRGISGVVKANREGLIPVCNAVLHGVLQFIPFINIFDSIILRIKIKKGN